MENENVTETPSEAVEVEKSLDDLLSEYDVPEVETQKPEPQAKPDPVSELSKKVDSLMQVHAESEFREGIHGAVETLKADEAVSKFPDRAITGFLHALGNENPAFKRAWENRKENPQAWKKSLGWATEEFKRDFSSLPDSQITADIEAASAAVRNISTEAPEKPDRPPVSELNKMSDREFANYKNSLG